MAQFNDSVGRVWIVQIEGAYSIKQVKARTGYNLGQLPGDKMEALQSLFSDPVQFIDVLFVLCSEQATKQGVTDEQFGRSISGDSLEDAADAFMEALADFCPRRQRKILKALAAKGREIMDQKTDEALRNLTSLNSAADMPVSSESTPTG